MSDETFSLSWLSIVAIVLVLEIVALAFLYVFQKVRGGVYRKEMRSSRALVFSTRLSEHRINKEFKQWAFKHRDDSTWSKVPFEDIVSIQLSSETSTASMLEFLFLGFGISDFFQKYRDVIHTNYISISLKDGEEIRLLALKQLEQREWFLSAIYHSFQLYILSKLGLYKSLEEVTETWIEFFINRVEPYGLNLHYDESRYSWRSR